MRQFALLVVLVSMLAGCNKTKVQATAQPVWGGPVPADLIEYKKESAKDTNASQRLEMHNISNEDLGCFVAHFTNYTRDEEAVDFGYFAFANGIKAGGREFAYVTLDDHATYDGGVFFKITSVQFCGTVTLW